MPDQDTSSIEDRDGTSCCGDYHYADCPIRTGAYEMDDPPNHAYESDELWRED